MASLYEGTVGVPALFDRAFFPALRALRGAQGAKQVIRGASRLATIPWPAGARDVDTPADAAALHR